MAGHSAGGQLAQRYAAISPSEDGLPRNVTMRYVAADPSSYLYLRPERPYFDPGEPGFDVPYRSSSPPDAEPWLPPRTALPEQLR